MFPFVRREEFYPGTLDESRSDIFQKIYEHNLVGFIGVAKRLWEHSCLHCAAQAVP
jgi:hypothetical protein